MLIYYSHTRENLKMNFIDNKIDDIIEQIKTEYANFINKNKRTIITKINEDINQDDYQEVNENDIENSETIDSNAETNDSISETNDSNSETNENLEDNFNGLLRSSLDKENENKKDL